MALMNGNYDQPVNIGNPDEYTVKDFAQVRRSGVQNDKSGLSHVVYLLQQRNE